MKRVIEVIGIILFGIAVGLAFSIQAADTKLNALQLDALLTGNTVYIAIPAGTPAGGENGGVAPVKYGSDGSVSAALPNGVKLVGSYTISGDRYCVDWDNGPKASCTSIVKSADGMMMVDANKNEPRGLVSRIVPGNPENL